MSIRIQTALAGLLACLSCLVLPATALAEGISIERASGRMKDGVYLMDASITYDLSNSVLEALLHGIQLQFDVTVEVQRERDWLWDPVIYSRTISYQLEYQPLSSNYLVTNLETGEKQQLMTLEESLRDLGSITSYPVVSADLLEKDRTYNCFIMSQLRIRHLPLPLQPLAYVSPNWHLASQWYEWTIR